MASNNVFMKSGHFVMKLMVAVLVLSFAVWGVGDVFRGGGVSGNSVVAEVGGRKITAQELSTVVDRQAEQLAQSLGTTPEQLKKTMQLAPQTLEQMVGEKLLIEQAKDLGIEVSDALVVDEISSNPRFRNPDGTFNRKEFEAFLKSIGETQKSFSDALKEGMAVRAMLEALMANPALPPPLIKRFYVYENEMRAASLLRIPASYDTKAAEPKEADLKAYYDANQHAFSVPETRSVSYALITKEYAEKEVKVTDEELKQAYEEHKAEYATPEQRTLKHIMFESEDAAKKAYEALKKGGDFDRIAKEDAKQSADQTNLGKIARADLFGGLDQQVFSLKKGELSEPLKSELGWHIFKVVEITAPTMKPFAEVKEQLKQQMREEKLDDYVYNLGTRVQDSLAGGSTLEEVAGTMGLKIEKVKDFTHEGATREGKPVALLKIKGFSDAVFAASKEDGAQMVESATGQSYILRVDAVEPEAVRPFDEVRAEVRKVVKQEAQEKSVKELAEKTSLKIQKGESTLAKEAEKLGLKLQEIKPITRNNSGYNLKVPPALVSEVFALTKTDDATASYRNQEGDYVIASLDQVIPAPALVAGKELEGLSKKLKSNVMNEMFAQLGTYLYRAHSVDVNEKLLGRMYATSKK